MHHRRKILGFPLLMLLCAPVGCGEPDAPVEPEPVMPQCGDWLPCPVGQTCRNGRCLDPMASGECRHPAVTKSCKGEWCFIPGGCFLMGSPTKEKCREPKGWGKETQHRVNLTHSFEISRSEVTQAQYTKVMGYNPACFQGRTVLYPCTLTSGLTCPAEWVTWSDAVEYCNTLSSNKGLTQCYQQVVSGTKCASNSVCNKDELCVWYRCTKFVAKPEYLGNKIYTCPGYRLPTDAEWEYAYRAGATTGYYNGPVDIPDCDAKPPKSKNLELMAWHGGNSDIMPSPVMGKASNAWGLYDMAGNVYEWCHDPFTMDLGSATTTDPVGKEEVPAYRCLRGGSYRHGAAQHRAATRYAVPVTQFAWSIGFRCVRSINP